MTAALTELPQTDKVNKQKKNNCVALSEQSAKTSIIQLSGIQLVHRKTSCAR